MNFDNELKNLIKANIPAIQIITYEWQRLYGFCVGIAQDNKLDLFTWSVTSGCKKWDKNSRVFIDENEEKDPIDLLEWFKEKSRKECILILEDFHPFITNNNFEAIRQIREICRIDSSLKKTLIIQTPFNLNVKEFEKEIPLLEIELPNEETLEAILESVTDNLDYDNKPNSEDKREIVTASKGLSIMEAEWTYRKIIADKNRLTKYEISLIIQEKEQIIKKSGVLEYFHPQGDFREVGGMENLKDWLEKRGKAFTKDAKDFGLVSPKGVMLLGIPGCGKSLVSKTIANEWELPLLKLDLGNVFGSLVGESEARMREALKLSEAISPSILWIDEIEKGLSGISDGGDNGTSAKVFGTLLTWMQEKKNEVFVISTANKIEALPPELLRKGRFDEIFFVDLPSSSERKEIFEIHIEKKERDISNFDLDKLSSLSIGFSGAEIEEAVNEALFIAYNDGREIETKDIEVALKETFPLSKTMANIIKDLRDWAKVRARFASNSVSEELPKSDEKIPTLAQEKHNPFIK
ncbi:AAA family ATPase [Aliarcobacter skirrowii]|uniref:AAA family ATPase n=1 Tax=Aliarcobacter skirrowii TaxID=28200 RepID=UPI0029B4BAC5|nr:AAA family ATPase [Aliarcobacter skirrowii]MDX4040073.1 AAA family ATPase [Aliarcobacter skirrowii]